MKKPDRFEKMVLSHSYDKDYIPTYETVKLLRAEHRAVVRLVKRAIAIKAIVGSGLISRMDLLTALSRRAK